MEPARRALLVVGLLTVGFAAGEAWLRVSDRLWYGAPFLANPSHADLAVADDQGLRGRPGARFEHWRMNSLGVQGPEVAVPRPPGVLRVVVLGASEMFGLYESRGMSTAEQLHGVLAARVPERVEVLNAALAGLSLPRTTEYCRRQLGKLDPSVVVYYPNPVTYLSDEVPAETFRPPAPPGDGARSRLLPRLLLLANRGVPDVLQGWRAERGSARYLLAQRASHPAEWAYHTLPEDRVEAFDRHLRALLDALPAGVPLVLASHAHRYHQPLTADDRAAIVAWQAFYPRADPEVLLAMEREANARVRAAAERRGAAFADVAARVPPGGRTFRDFTHFTDEGAGLAARAIADAIAPAAVSSSGR